MFNTESVQKNWIKKNNKNSDYKNKYTLHTYNIKKDNAVLENDNKT